MSRNAVKVTLTTTFTVPAPTNDELIELAMDASIEGDEHTEDELDKAYENWKDSIAEEYESGKEPPDNAEHDIDMEEVHK